MTSTRKRFAVAAGVLAAVLAVLVPILPGLDDEFTVSVLTGSAISAYLASSWNVQGGLTGQLSFAHGLFFGAGAYGAAAFQVRHGWNPILGGLVGVVAAVLMALVIGYVCFRSGLSHLYFALATTAFAEIGLYLAGSWHFIGGVEGLTLPFDVGGAELRFDDSRIYYWIFVALTVLVLLGTVLLKRRKLGLYMQCVRENEQTAAAVGISILRVKLIAMMISAALTAVGGMLYAQYIRFLDPSSMLGWTITLQMIVLPAIIGGARATLGPVIGAIIYVVLREETRVYFSYTGASLIALGVVVCVIVLLIPKGVVPFATEVGAKFSGRRKKPDVDGSPPRDEAPTGLATPVGSGRS